MFSFGEAHPDAILFSIAEPFSKGKQTPIWQSEKRSTYWQAENETVLSIWNTDHYLLDAAILLPKE